jgi:hypothetical protein
MPASESALATTQGEWVKYRQGRDHMPLVNSLQGHGTGWCTAGESTAEAQLKAGDFYVYYSYDENKKPNVPRAAIRMQENRIAEVRGIAHEQNLDPYMNDIVKEKLSEFPDGKAYEKKTADMKLITGIEKKTIIGQELTKAELIFIYEIDSPIEGFGYQRDPRIEEIRKTRKLKEDALIVFECQPNQIAYQAEDIKENTKAYIGEWSIEVFQIVRNYPNITHLYESFPDRKIFKETLETDPRVNSPETCEETLKAKNIYLSDWAKDILHQTQFSRKKEKYELVRFTVKQLGFLNGATTEQIYKRAEELGLELCPAEVGPHLRLKNLTKEWMLIAMKPIEDRAGDPDVFFLDWWEGGKLRLRAADARPSFKWPPGNGFVFRFRPSSRAELATGQASQEA